MIGFSSAAFVSLCGFAVWWTLLAGLSLGFPWLFQLSLLAELPDTIQAASATRPPDPLHPFSKYPQQGLGVRGGGSSPGRIFSKPALPLPAIAVAELSLFSGVRKSEWRGDPNSARRRSSSFLPPLLARLVKLGTTSAFNQEHLFP